MAADEVYSKSHLSANADGATAALREVDRYGYRLVVDGFIAFDHDSERFDALYRSRADGTFRRRHELLSWSPAPLEPSGADRAHSRYEFTLPAAWKEQSVQLSFNIDPLVREFLIPPSEVRAKLSGQLTMTVIRVPLVPPFPWATVGMAAIPLTIGGTGLAFVLQRRRLFGGLAPDLRLQAERLEAKYRVARRAVSAEQAQMLPVAQRLSSLREGAHQLVRRLQSLRNLQGSHHRGVLAGELDSLRVRLSQVRDERARREGALAVAEKEKSLALLNELDATEAHCALRLARIEALLESATLSLQHSHFQDTSQSADAMGDALCRDLDAELAALREVSHESPLAGPLVTSGVTRLR